MRLIKVCIKGYKHLKNVSADFNGNSPEGIFRDKIPIRFFIGLNGSGKSVFLEAIGLLFSRIAQDEVPGFSFTLIYEIQRESLYRVEVTNGTRGEKMKIQVFRDGERVFGSLHSFESCRFLLPDYVFTCASGSNNNFYDLVVRSPKDSLYSDLFDVSFWGKSKKNAGERKAEAERILLSLKRLEENPMCLFIDEKSSVLVLAALLAFRPDRSGIYGRRRWEILSMLESAPRPVSLSFILSEKEVQERGEQLLEYGAAFEAACAKEQRVQSNFLGWSATRLYQDESGDGAKAVHGDRVITWLFQSFGEPDEADFEIPRPSQSYEDGMEFLAKMNLAYRQGILKDVHMGFKIKGTENLVEENAFSEGEFMLLVRLGLFALGGSGRADRQCVFLMDEPDVYLNEHWNIDFISMTHRLFENAGANHEIIVATHSSLMLTDAFPDQLYYFRNKNGSVDCMKVLASTFGGSRNEIMEKLFQTERSVGSYSYEKIERLLYEADDLQTLEASLRYIGSGYMRMRILDKIQLLRKGRG